MHVCVCACVCVCVCVCVCERERERITGGTEEGENMSERGGERERQTAREREIATYLFGLLLELSEVESLSQDDIPPLPLLVQPVLLVVRLFQGLLHVACPDDEGSWEAVSGE